MVQHCLVRRFTQLSIFLLGLTTLSSVVVAEGEGGRKSKVTKEKNIVREKIYRGDSKKIDFESTDIGGERKSPFGSMINQNKASKDYDLIKIRWRWNDKMKHSTSSIENGRGS